jgi:hypothetical protein
MQAGQRRRRCRPQPAPYADAIILRDLARFCRIFLTTSRELPPGTGPGGRSPAPMRIGGGFHAFLCLGLPADCR